MLGATLDTVASIVSWTILMVPIGTVGQGLTEPFGHFPINAFDKNANIVKSLPRIFITTLVIVLSLPCFAPESDVGLRGEA